MKNVKFRFRNITTATLTILALTCLSQVAFAQATIESNTPSSGAFLGWDDINNTFLDVRQDDLLRMRFRGVPYAPVGGPPSGLGGSNYTSASRIIIDVEDDNTDDLMLAPQLFLERHTLYFQIDLADRRPSLSQKTFNNNVLACIASKHRKMKNQ